MATVPQQIEPPIPPPVPIDAIIDSNQLETNIADETIETANNDNDVDNNIEMDYTNIQIPEAIPTESIRDLMYDNDNENNSDSNNENNVSTPLLEDDQLHIETTHEVNTNDNDNENNSENSNKNDNVSTPLLEDDQLPHNATTHNAKLDLNFDTQTNEIIFNVTDEITNKTWYMRLNSTDFDNPIRDEFNTIGTTISTGTCVYKYPKNNSINPIIVTITNNTNEYTYTIPDIKAQNVTQNETKTPEIQPPKPPKPPVVIAEIKVENLDDSDSEPPPPANHMANDSLYFDDAPKQIHIATGAIPKSPSKSASPGPMQGLDGIIMTGDIEYNNDNINHNHTNNQELLQEGSPEPMNDNYNNPSPILMSGHKLPTMQHETTKSMDIGVENEIVNGNYNTELNANNEAAKTFLTFYDNNKQQEEEINEKKQNAIDALSWYTSYKYKNETKPWWMPIDVFDNLDDNNVGDLATFDDQLPKNAVTRQHNLLEKQMFHIKQQEMIKEQSANENESKNNEIEIVIENDPLRRKQIDVNRLGNIDTPEVETPIGMDVKNKYDLKDKKMNISKNLIMQNELMIDFNIIIRKFILYTCVLFELTLLMLICCSIYGFYQWKGYIINILCLLLFGIGIFIGFKSETQWSMTNRLYIISYYWLICVIVIFISFMISLIYIISFSYAINHDFVVVCLLCLTYLIWFILVLFYIDFVARLIIICGKFYDLWSQLRGMKYFIHKTCYKFTKTFNNFRNCMARNTGIRFDDLIHLTCCCIYLKRQQTNIITVNENENNIMNNTNIEINKEWEPILNNYALKFRKKYKICRGLKLNCCDSANASGHQRRSSYDLTGGELIDITSKCGCCQCMSCCKPYGICLQECTMGIGLCWSSFFGRFMNVTCCGCFKKDVDYDIYEDIENNNCHDCNIGNLKCNCYWLCDGQSAIYVNLCMIIGIFLLLPFIMFCIIVMPFWLFAQFIVFRFINSKCKFFVVVIVFVILLIPPFILWFLLFDLICENSNGDVKIICYLWSVVNTIYE